MKTEVDEVVIQYCFSCATPLLSLTSFLEHGRVKGHRVEIFRLKQQHRADEVRWSTDWGPER